jgi:deazaflavin-dependent oxidoreductase (nitroreductase family)
MAADRKRRLVVWFEKHLQNPPVRLALLAGLPLPPLALLETTGRSSGNPRRTPLIDGLVGDQFWIVAEHGRHAHYVRNLKGDPRVRVQRRRRWHRGLVRVLDPRRSAGPSPLAGRHPRAAAPSGPDRGASARHRPAHHPHRP